jgi:hypothetical protein
MRTSAEGTDHTVGRSSVELGGGGEVGGGLGVREARGERRASGRRLGILDREVIVVQGRDARNDGLLGKRVVAANCWRLLA